MLISRFAVDDHDARQAQRAAHLQGVAHHDGRQSARRLPTVPGSIPTFIFGPNAAVSCRTALWKNVHVVVVVMGVASLTVCGYHVSPNQVMCSAFTLTVCT